MRMFIFLMLLCVSFSAKSEVYRWVDDKGKAHFDDKKPKGKSDDITAKVTKQNIDSSTLERQKLETIFRKENDADRAYQQQQQTQQLTELAKKCTEAKNYLDKIDGRVQFIDDEGKPINISEEQRKARVVEMNTIIQSHCPK